MAAANERKHGVRFEDAMLAFDDPFALTAESSYAAERRQILIGMSTENVLVVIYTVRGAYDVRVISARKAGRKERTRYEQARTIPL